MTWDPTQYLKFAGERLRPEVPRQLIPRPIRSAINPPPSGPPVPPRPLSRRTSSRVTSRCTWLVG